MNRGLNILIAAVVFLILIPVFVFVISEREMAVVLRLGKPVRQHTEPGIHFRIPFVETVERMPKTKQFWGDEHFIAGRESSVKSVMISDVTTSDNMKIDLIPWALWRIKNPKDFLQRLRTVDQAEKRVAQVSRSVIRDVIAQHNLAELIRSTKRVLPSSNDSVQQAAQIADAALPQEVAQEKPVATVINFGRTALLDMIREESKRRLVEQGEGEEDIGAAIEIVDVGVSQVTFVESVRQNTFDRWIAERAAISMGILKEGETRKAMIINAANAEVQRIEGSGQKEASEIRGKADAEIIRRYAEAIAKVGDFYTFTRTLKAYESAINKDSRMILSTDNEFLKMIQNLDAEKK